MVFSGDISALLADSYTLHRMTHNFHWNVTGQQPNSRHAMFMDQYTEQWTALDLIAERIRALGFLAPGTYKQYVALASIEEIDGAPKANDMVRRLVVAQEATARTARRLFALVDAAIDQVSADVLTQRIGVHEKTVWMLRSLLEYQARRRREGDPRCQSIDNVQVRRPEPPSRVCQWQVNPSCDCQTCQPGRGWLGHPDRTGNSHWLGPSRPSVPQLPTRHKPGRLARALLR